MAFELREFDLRDTDRGDGEDASRCAPARRASMLRSEIARDVPDRLVADSASARRRS